MRKNVILITGASGEIGQALITHLAERGDNNILAIDIRPVSEPLRSMCQISIVGDILDTGLFERLVSEYAIETIYHLASLLSTRAEFTPEAAQGKLYAAFVRPDTRIPFTAMPDAVKAMLKSGRASKEEYLIPTISRRYASQEIKDGL